MHLWTRLTQCSRKQTKRSAHVLIVKTWDKQLGRLTDRSRRDCSCIIGENKNAAAFYRRLCIKFEYLNIRRTCSHAYSRHSVQLFYFPTSRVSSPHPSNIYMQASSSFPRTNYRGPVKLSSHEVKWRDRQPFLESKGYMLRPRLRPGWTPSWLSTGEDHYTCEDGARLPVS